MNDLNRRLQSVFRFSDFDVRANRAGRLTSRQSALLRTSQTGAMLGLGVFFVVMLGTLVFIGFMIAQSQGLSPLALLRDPSAVQTLSIAASVIMVVVVVGALISRPYIATTRSTTISTARGSATIASAKEGNIAVRIGSTRLRLTSEDQLSAFEPGVEYEMYYLAGPMPFIVSAAVAGSEIALGESEEPAAQDDAIQAAKRGWVIAVLVGGLALAIPFAGVLATGLPELLRCAVMAGLIALAFAFVPFALWFIGRR